MNFRAPLQSPGTVTKHIADRADAWSFAPGYFPTAHHTSVIQTPASALRQIVGEAAFGLKGGFSYFQLSE
jgi:hypothetical protein